MILLIPVDLVWGVDWQFYSANEYYFCLYDPGRVLRPEPEVVQVWTNWIATKEGKKYRTQEMARMKVPKSVSERYESTRVRMAIHCADRTYQVLSISDYDEQQREIGNGSRACFLESSTQPPDWKEFQRRRLGSNSLFGPKRPSPEGNSFLILNPHTRGPPP